jgi:hypothetical protein
MKQSPAAISTKFDHQDTSKIDIKSSFSDILFFLCVVGLPSNFFGMVDPEWFYIPGFFDFRMIFILFCALLSIFMMSRWRVLLQLPAGAWLFLVAFYVAVHFIFSALQFGFTDAFKVFRYYCLPIVTMGPLLYILSLSRERQVRLIRWVFIATILQGIFYILHHAGFSVFYSPVHELIYFGAGEVQRYNHAFPPYASLVMNAALLFIIFQKRWHYALYAFVLAGVIVLYATRGVIISATFSIMLILALTMFKQSGKALGRIGIITLFTLMVSVLFMIVFPQYPEFIAERFLELTGPEGLRSSANYNIRMMSVDIAVNDMTTVKDMLFGHGYEFRSMYEYFPGNPNAELAMQGDAPIAGLLFTEGILGVFLRAVPFLIFLFIHWRLFLQSQNVEDIIISVLVIVSIGGIGVGWLQTTALRDLPFSLLPFFILHCLHSCSSKESVSSEGETNDAVLHPMSVPSHGKIL